MLSVLALSVLALSVLALSVRRCVRCAVMVPTTSGAGRSEAGGSCGSTVNPAIDPSAPAASCDREHVLYRITNVAKRRLVRASCRMMGSMKPGGTLAAWAIAALKGTPQAKAARTKVDKLPSPLAVRFGLDALERRILELAWAVERSLAVAQAARARGGGLTVELVRATLGDEVDAALSPRRALRRHALVTTGAGGLATAVDVVRLAPGVAARLDGHPDAEGLWRGYRRGWPRSSTSSTMAWRRC
jgi:hypothetical protein